MNTILYIKANPKNNEESRTFRISERFIEAYREYAPGDRVLTLDLYAMGCQFLDEGSRYHAFVAGGGGRASHRTPTSSRRPTSSSSPRPCGT